VRNRLDRVFRGEPGLVGLDLDERIQLVKMRTRGLELGPSDVGSAVDDLALEVGFVDHVEVDDPDSSHPGGREVERER
jgi:hypothetical protein